MKFERVVERISKVLAQVCMGLLAIMLFLGAADVVGRYFLNRPITGTLEVFEILLPGIVLLGLAYTQLNKAHIRVDILVDRLPSRLQAIVSFFVTIWLIILFILVTWQGTMIAISLWQQHRTIPIIGVPVFAIQLIIPFGALVMCLVLVVDLIHFYAVMKADSGKER